MATGAKDAELRTFELPLMGRTDLYPVSLAQAVIAGAVLLLPGGGGKSLPLGGLVTALVAIYVVFVGSQPNQPIGGSPTYVIPPATVFQAVVIVTLLLLPNLAEEPQAGRKRKSD